MRVIPTLEQERVYWQQGISLIAGIDEVGMGALAGPVVAAAVIVPPIYELDGVRDSKQLTVKQRERVAVQLTTTVTAWAVGEASVEEIDMLNIRRASHLAMRRAVEALSIVPELLLIDGRGAAPHPSIPAVNIIKGDSSSISIAAASILAKVHRDRLMTALHEQHPAYNFASNKGYGAKVHLEALQHYGVTAHHRRTYAPIAALLPSPQLT